MHTCDNPPCVNPAHLRVATQADNVADMEQKRRSRKARGMAHGRQTKPHRTARGEQTNRGHITERHVQVIRYISANTTLSYVQIAMLMGITPPHARLICIGRSWAHVTPMQSL